MEEGQLGELERMDRSWLQQRMQGDPSPGPPSTTFIERLIYLSHVAA